MITTRPTPWQKLRQVPMFAALVSFGSGPLLGQPVELVVNGSFESGDFSGWTVSHDGFPFGPWMVNQAGSGSGNPLAATAPPDGTYVAWNGFDGFGMPMQFLMFQDVAIPEHRTVTLTWLDRVQWSYAFPPANPRLYQVGVADPATGEVWEILSALDTGVVPGLGDTGWQVHGADLSRYAGSTIRLVFRQVIPEPFTGPAQVEVDAISMMAASADGDADGIPDAADACPASDLAPTVVIGGCESGVANVLFPEGCTLADLLHQCELEAQNHGQFVRRVAALTGDLKEAGVLSGTAKGKIQSCAARAGTR